MWNTFPGSFGTAFPAVAVPATQTNAFRRPGTCKCTHINSTNVRCSTQARQRRRELSQHTGHRPALLPALLVAAATAHASAAPALAYEGPSGGSGGQGGGHGVHGHNGGGGGGSWGPAGPQDIALVAGDKDDKKEKPILLTMASFAVTRKAYAQIIKMFMREYEQDTGKAVRFRCAYAGSGTQARAVIDGLPADIVALALPLDIQKICDADLIDSNWQTRLPNKAVVCSSVVALVYRAGNPKNIKGWDDLIREDVSVVTANPKTAGVARWNFLALWGHRLKKGEKAALQYCTDVFKRVAIQPRDAREASDVFIRQKVGDVLLTYENEIVLTNEIQPTHRLPYIVPDNNVVVENPVAVVDRNVDKRGPEVRAAAEAFVHYLYSPAAQQVFAECGFRSVDKAIVEKQPLPKVSGTWQAEAKLGNWDRIQAKFFGDKGILDGIQREVGEYKLQQRMQQRTQPARA